MKNLKAVSPLKPTNLQEFILTKVKFIHYTLKKTLKHNCKVLIGKSYKEILKELEKFPLKLRLLLFKSLQAIINIGITSFNFNLETIRVATIFFTSNKTGKLLRKIKFLSKGRHTFLQKKRLHLIIGIYNDQLSKYNYTF